MDLTLWIYFVHILLNFCWPRRGVVFEYVFSYWYNFFMCKLKKKKWLNEFIWTRLRCQNRWDEVICCIYFFLSERITQNSLLYLMKKILCDTFKMLDKYSFHFKICRCVYYRFKSQFNSYICVNQPHRPAGSYVTTIKLVHFQLNMNKFCWYLFMRTWYAQVEHNNSFSMTETRTRHRRGFLIWNSIT